MPLDAVSGAAAKARRPLLTMDDLDAISGAAAPADKAGQRRKQLKQAITNPFTSIQDDTTTSPVRKAAQTTYEAARMPVAVLAAGGESLGRQLLQGAGKANEALRSALPPSMQFASMGLDNDMFKRTDPRDDFLASLQGRSEGVRGMATDPIQAALLGAPIAPASRMLGGLARGGEDAAVAANAAREAATAADAAEAARAAHANEADIRAGILSVTEPRAQDLRDAANLAESKVFDLPSRKEVLSLHNPDEGIHPYEMIDEVINPAEYEAQRLRYESLDPYHTKAVLRDRLEHGLESDLASQAGSVADQARAAGDAARKAGSAGYAGIASRFPALARMAADVKSNPFMTAATTAGIHGAQGAALGGAQGYAQRGTDPAKTASLGALLGTGLGMFGSAVDPYVGNTSRLTRELTPQQLTAKQPMSPADLSAVMDEKWMSGAEDMRRAATTLYGPPREFSVEGAGYQQRKLWNPYDMRRWLTDYRAEAPSLAEAHVGGDITGRAGAAGRVSRHLDIDPAVLNTMAENIRAKPFAEGPMTDEQVAEILRRGNQSVRSIKPGPAERELDAMEFDAEAHKIGLPSTALADYQAALRGDVIGRHSFNQVHAGTTGDAMAAAKQAGAALDPEDAQRQLSNLREVIEGPYFQQQQALHKARREMYPILPGQTPRRIQQRPNVALSPSEAQAAIQQLRSLNMPVPPELAHLEPPTIAAPRKMAEAAASRLEDRLAWAYPEYAHKLRIDKMPAEVLPPIPVLKRTGAQAIKSDVPTKLRSVFAKSATATPTAVNVADSIPQISDYLRK